MQLLTQQSFVMTRVPHSLPCACDCPFGPRLTHILEGLRMGYLAGKLSARSRRSTSKDDEGDKAQWGMHRTVAARYPVDDRGSGMHFFLFLSVHSLVSSY